MSKPNHPQFRDPKLLCTANRSNGRGRCRAYRVAGSTVCRVHGGAAKQVVRKARERLDALADPAIAELNKIIRRSDVSDADRLRAIEAVLDRITGLSKRSVLDGRVAVQVQPSPEYAAAVAEARRRVAESDERGLQGKAFELSDLEEIEDAELVDTDGATELQPTIPHEADDPEDDPDVIPLWIRAPTSRHP